MRITSILVATVLLLGACGQRDVPEMEQPPETEQLPALRLYVFDCGGLRFDSIEPFSISDDEIDIRELAVPCYMVEHENGRLLWDGGIPSVVAETAGWQGKGMQMKLDRTLAEQLADIDLGMDSFDFVAFSHMHFDHIGVANELVGATLLIQKPEYEAAYADPITVPGYDPDYYDDLEDLDYVLLEGDHDVFGDGKVRIIAAPGHTPGHQVLFVDLLNTDPVVLSGDLYHFAFSRDNRRVPEFNVDREQTLASMERVEALVAESDGELWIEHELARFERQRKAPSYYD